MTLINYRKSFVLRDVVPGNRYYGIINNHSQQEKIAYGHELNFIYKKICF